MAMRPIENVITMSGSSAEVDNSRIDDAARRGFFKPLSGSVSSLFANLFGRNSLSPDTDLKTTAMASSAQGLSDECPLSLTVVADPSGTRLLAVNPTDQPVPCGQLMQGIFVVEDQVIDLNAALCRLPDVLAAHSINQVELEGVSDCRAHQLEKLPVIDSGVSFYPLVNGHEQTSSYKLMQDALPA